MPQAQAQVAQAMVSIGQKLGAPLSAILADLCIGAGENNWVTDTCNPSNHCGIYQLSSTLQAQHDFTDYVYWTYRAYQQGFWRGSLIGSARANPSASPGYLANLCQGAYSDLTAGANYYNRYLSQATGLYNQYKGSSAPSAPAQAGAPSGTPGTSAGVDFSPIQDAIQNSSAGDAMGPGTTNAANRAHQGYLDSQSTWNEYAALHVFTTKGGS